MAKQKKTNQRKLAEINLTAKEREILAEGVNSEFFKIIQEKILPQRRVQLALTAIEAEQRMEDIWYHRGMMYMCKWLPDWISGKVAKVDADATYDNDDDSVGAEDEDLV